MKKLSLMVFLGLCGMATMAAAEVSDNLVPNLNYKTQGVKDVFYAKNNPAKTILRHIQAFASHEPETLAADYKNNSTFTFGPFEPSSGGNTYEAVGKVKIKDTFAFFFTGGGLPQFSVMTVTSASRIGNQFYQTFDLNNGCIGSDTFLITGNKIGKQTVFAVCK